MNFLSKGEKLNKKESTSGKGNFSLASFLKFKKENKDDFSEKNKENKKILEKYHDELKNNANLKLDEFKVDDKSFLSKKEGNLSGDDGKWKVSSVIQTNLIKNEASIYIDWEKNIIISLVYFFLFALLVGGSYFGINYWSKQIELDSNKLSAETEKLTKELDDIKQSIGEVDIFERRLGIAKLYLNNHIYWTNFFKFIEDNTLKNVFFGEVASFDGDISGEYSFTAKTNQYQDITNQLRVFRDNELVLKAESNEGKMLRNKDEEGNLSSSVNFKIELVIDNNIFYKKDSLLGQK